MGVTLAKGLLSLHAAGVQHLDIKPNNIFLDAQGEPRLADYGISHLITSRLTPYMPRGWTLSTPNYSYALAIVCIMLCLLFH